jgi:acyl-CoA thioesterase FadM
MSLRARDAFDENLHGSVRQLQKLQHRGERTRLVDGIGGRIIVTGTTTVVCVDREGKVRRLPDWMLVGA